MYYEGGELRRDGNLRTGHAGLGLGKGGLQGSYVSSVSACIFDHLLMSEGEMALELNDPFKAEHMSLDDACMAFGSVIIGRSAKCIIEVLQSAGTAYPKAHCE